MRHPSGVVLNLLGPATMPDDTNILMDVDDKYPGITHVALTVGSLEETRAFMEANDIAITGSFSFGNMSAIFIRDPDRNVIELDAYIDGADGRDQGDQAERAQGLGAAKLIHGGQIGHARFSFRFRAARLDDFFLEGGFRNESPSMTCLLYTSPSPRDA